MGCELWDNCEAQRQPTSRLAHLRQRRAYVYMLKRPLTALPVSPAASAGTSCKPWKRSSILVYNRLCATVCTSIAHHPRLRRAQPATRRHGGNTRSLQRRTGVVRHWFAPSEGRRIESGTSGVANETDKFGSSFPASANR
jgi:hypothetical protein